MSVSLSVSLSVSVSVSVDVGLGVGGWVRARARACVSACVCVCRQVAMSLQRVCLTEICEEVLTRMRASSLSLVSSRLV